MEENKPSDAHLGAGPEQPRLPRTVCEGSQTIGELLARLQAGVDAGRINPNEPCFLLRGQDVLAPATVNYWAWQLTQNSGPRYLIEGSRQTAAAMEAWRPRKLPD